MKKIFLRISLAGLSVLFAVLACEALVRLLPYLPITSMGAVMQPDPLLDHSLRPNSVGRMKSREYNVKYRINSYGLRDNEPDSHAILILGDSFMEGYGVEADQTVAAMLEKAGHPTINAGVKSYSPLLQYLYLANQGIQFHPDTVILFLDLSDPINDIYYSEKLVTGEDGLPKRVTPTVLKLPYIPDGVHDALNDHSRLYAQVLHKYRKSIGADTHDVGYAGMAQRDDLLFAGRATVPDTEYFQKWEKTFEYLLLIRDLTDSEGIDFILVTYPYGHQVSGDAWTEGRIAHGFPPGVSSPNRPFRDLERWGDENSITVLALDIPFRNHPDPGSLYFTYDGHWTPEGHRYTAQLLDEWLRGRDSF